MCSNLCFNHSRFIANYPYTLPLEFPLADGNAIIFSLKTDNIDSTQVYLWHPKKVTLMLNILFYWNEISNIFEPIKKSTIYNSKLAEVYLFSLKKTFIQQFDTTIEAIVYARLLLELAVEKANKATVFQMNYITTANYLEVIEVHDLLLTEDGSIYSDR